MGGRVFCLFGFWIKLFYVNVLGIDLGGFGVVCGLGCLIFKV